MRNLIEHLNCTFNEKYLQSVHVNGRSFCLQVLFYFRKQWSKHDVTGRHSAVAGWKWTQ